MPTSSQFLSAFLIGDQAFLPSPEKVMAKIRHLNIVHSKYCDSLT